VALRHGVIVQVGPYFITRASLDRWMRERMRATPATERLVPPEFVTCVTHLREEPATAEDSEADGAQLQKECAERYRGVQQSTLERLIASVWVLEGARELGASASSGVGAQAQLKAAGTARRAATVAPGISTAATRELRAVHAAIADRAGSPGRAEVARHYEQHRGRYVAAQERRDVEIVKAKTEARASQAKREIASGKSFAQMVKESGLAEADYSSEGLAPGLLPNVYGEPKLNRAMFAARPNVLTGPIGTSFGYFVFEVKKVKPARYKPLSAVARSIRDELTRRRRRQALAAFLARWHAKWSAKTTCSPGFVVRGCQEFSGSGMAPPNVLYTLG
jgi:PPIC-type PPIASE domain